MTWFKKAKFSLALLLGSAFLAATDASAITISEARKLPERDLATYTIDVINEHLKLVAKKDIALAKKAEIYMYGSSKTGLYQGVVDIVGKLDLLAERGYGDTDVGKVFESVFNGFCKQNGITARAKDFFPAEGLKVAFNPADKGDKNIASLPVESGRIPASIAMITPK